MGRVCGGLVSYIAFELDALNVVPDVAAASGLSPGDVAHGLLKLWAWCFRNKTATVTDVHLSGFFTKPVGESLEAFGFVVRDDLAWRVKGADRYLRVAEGRRKGGLAAAKNLIPGGFRQPRGGAEGKPRGKPRSSREAAEADAGLMLGLSPSTEHRAPNELHAGRTKPLTERLVATFAQVRGSKYAFGGIEDATGIKRLLEWGTDDEIDRRWRLALSKGQDWPGTSSIAQLASAKRWNDLATVKEPFVSVEERPSRMM